MNKEEQKYPLIPMSEITDEARKIAVAWCDNWTPMGRINLESKHKLASDIMNYARNSQPPISEKEKELEAARKENERLKGLVEKNFKSLKRNINRISGVNEHEVDKIVNDLWKMYQLEHNL